MCRHPALIQRLADHLCFSQGAVRAVDKKQGFGIGSTASASGEQSLSRRGYGNNAGG